MGKYFLENVHTANPTAEIFILVGSRGAMIRELFLDYPWLTVLEANRRSPKSLFRAWQALQGVDIALTQVSDKPFSTVSKVFARLRQTPAYAVVAGRSGQAKKVSSGSFREGV
jgi:hypothetical protein